MIQDEHDIDSDSHADRKLALQLLSDPNNYEINISRSVGLTSIGSADDIANIMLNMKWKVGQSKYLHLVTSDSPVTRLTDPNTRHQVYGDGGMYNKTARINLPLSSKHMLEMTWSENEREGVVDISKPLAKRFNAERASWASRFLFANQKDNGISKLGSKWVSIASKVQVDSGLPTAKINVVRSLDPR